ncbi:hypothetical protein POVCU2_0013690 [Plasmodium ovale curtisi]|uniref:PIR Superfamily Protein n=1 Tax=Plasmodium ovale curtisi TaxID=864141 RepID=A0A1A8VQW7_PLAOA|nr:hypothetical protein POVCU2_0013690 [Plasmodium ovale curtisi]
MGSTFVDSSIVCTQDNNYQQTVSFNTFDNVNEKDKYNFKREIKTCDYCKYFKKSLKKFIEIGKNECNCENNANVSHQHKSVHLTDKVLMYRIHRVGESDNVILNTDSSLGSFFDDAISGEFTELGKFLRHRTKWSSYIQVNSEEDVEELLLLDFKNECVKTHASEYHIEYNSSQIY